MGKGVQPGSNTDPSQSQLRGGEGRGKNRREGGGGNKPTGQERALQAEADESGDAARFAWSLSLLICKIGLSTSTSGTL